MTIRPVYTALIFTAVLILLCAIRIANTEIAPRMDQNFARTTFQTPENERASSSGPLPHWFAEVYNAIFDWDETASNAGMRIVAMVAFIGAGGLLFTTRSAPLRLSVLFILLLVTSRYPFLWTSHELLGGALAMLILWSMVRKLPFVITAIFVVGFSLVKLDMIFSGALIGLYLAFASAERGLLRLRNLAVLIVLLAAAALPSMTQGNLSALNSSRQVVSFAQHYSALVADHQVAFLPLPRRERPDPWFNFGRYFNPIWGRQNNMIDLVRGDPYRYYDFLFLSLGRSIINLSSSNVLWLFPLAGYGFLRLRDRKLKIVTLLFLLGFIPIQLIAFTHVRYVARFYPLVLYVIYAYLVDRPEDEERRARRIMSGALIALLAYQIFESLPVWSTGEWFPD
ncbi:MAG: hypothetical protein H7175_28150 [Burkholderiales bacterium]|nr:hypothetical protein [Anaerolineae bacterium]